MGHFIFGFTPVLGDWIKGLVLNFSVNLWCKPNIKWPNVPERMCLLNEFKSHRSYIGYNKHCLMNWSTVQSDNRSSRFRVAVLL